jgi:hypothetical protein
MSESKMTRAKAREVLYDENQLHELVCNDLFVLDMLMVRSLAYLQ